MRKSMWAAIVALALLGPAVLAQEIPQAAENDSTSWWVAPSDESEVGDACREECAEDGADPDECQMDCNVVT